MENVIRHDKLLIIGAGGHGRVVAEIALRMDHWRQIVFLDDDPNRQAVLGVPVIDTTKNAAVYVDEYDCFVAIGNNMRRAPVQTQLELAGANLPVLVHPNVCISSQEVTLGAGTVVIAGAVINCCSHMSGYRLAGLNKFPQLKNLRKF